MANSLSFAFNLGVVPAEGKRSFTARGTCWPCSGRRRICDLRPFEPVSAVTFVGTIFVSLPEESNHEVGHQPHDGGNDQHRQQLAHGCAPSNRRNSVSLICAFRYWSSRPRNVRLYG